jgi:hypothetical protein
MDKTKDGFVFIQGKFRYMGKDDKIEINPFGQREIMRPGERYELTNSGLEKVGPLLSSHKTFEASSVNLHSSIPSVEHVSVPTVEYKEIPRVNAPCLNLKGFIKSENDDR